MSYEASAEYDSKEGNGYMITLDGGSYNPGNQPEYGKDWEYYDVFVHKLSDDGGGFLIEKKSFHGKKEAERCFKYMTKKYIE